MGDPLDYRARVTRLAKGSSRDQLDQSDVLAEALKRYDPAIEGALGFKSPRDYQELILKVFERHWECQRESDLLGNPV